MFQDVQSEPSVLLFAALCCKSDACFDACKQKRLRCEAGRSNKRIRDGMTMIGYTRTGGTDKEVPARSSLGDEQGIEAIANTLLGS